MGKKPLGDAMSYGFIVGVRIFEKMEANEIKITELSSRQIEDLVIQELEIFKKEKIDKKEKINLTPEQEKNFISTMTRIFKKVRKTKRAESKIQLFSFPTLHYLLLTIDR